MNMLYRLLTASAAVGALALLGLSGQADATTRLMLKASPLTVLAADEENPEVQNLLDPESDNGQPGGGDATPAPAPEPNAEMKPGGEMQAKPEGGGDSENKEIDQEEGK
jgi:hypothetical protein